MESTQQSKDLMQTGIEGAQHVKEYIKDKASTLTQSEFAGNVKSQITTFRDQSDRVIDDSEAWIRENPLLAVGGALVIGTALGAFLSRR